MTITDDTALPANAIEGLGISEAAARIVRYFLLRPERRPHLRELQRVLDLGGASVQRELERFVRIGALQRHKEGRQTHYRAVTGSAVWNAIRILEANSADPTPLVRNAFTDVAGIEAAFLFGSFAKGTQRSDSDLDLFVIESPTVDKKRLFTQLGELQLVLGREVNAVRYTQRSLAERLGDRKHPGSSFVRKTLTGPKRWVAGAASNIAPVAISAGLRIPELSNAGSTAVHKVKRRHS